MHTYVNLFMHTHHACVHTYVQKSTYACMCIYTYIHIYIYTHVYVYVYVYVYIYIYIYIYIQVFTHTHTHIYIYIYIHTHTHMDGKFLLSLATRCPREVGDTAELTVSDRLGRLQWEGFRRT